MQFPAVTAIYAGLLSLILIILSGWVIAGRMTLGVNLGDGNKPDMQVRVRSHANFIEYVPLILLFVALLEMAHTSRFVVHVLLLPLLVARVLHPFGLMTAPMTGRQFALRGAPTIITLLILGASGILLLLRGLEMPG